MKLVRVRVTAVLPLAPWAIVSAAGVSDSASLGCAYGEGERRRAVTGRARCRPPSGL